MTGTCASETTGRQELRAGIKPGPLTLSLVESLHACGLQLICGSLPGSVAVPAVRSREGWPGFRALKGWDFPAALNTHKEPSKAGKRYCQLMAPLDAPKGVVMRLLLMASVAFLTACGGGGASPEAPAKQPTKVCPPTVTVQVFGDSTQEQQGNYLQLALDLALGPGRVVVENHGLSGTTAAEFPATKVKPGAITVVNYGINDSRADGASVEKYKARLRAIAPAIFETPSPPFDGYAQAMRDVAKELGKPVADVSAGVRAMPGWQARVPDGVHPDPGLYWMISRDMVAPVVADAVKQVSCAL